MLYQSKTLIKRCLNAHGWLGISLGAAMYLICITGTLLVFVHEFERWQQPNVDEFSELKPAAINTALQQLLARTEQAPDSVFVVLPSPAMPRAHIDGGDEHWFIDSNGHFTEPEVEGWVHILRTLHYYLSLPTSFGMIVVGILGVMLLALTLSGVLAHPSIVKDAFKLRIFQSYRLQQTDIHNRLGVWGMPFSIMIATTGAFIGLVSILIAAAAPVFYNGDRDAIVDIVYGGDPVVEQQVQPFNVEHALSELKQLAPTATPIYIAFQYPGKTSQFLEIAATLPQRLTYSEIYRFSASGEFINHQGLADGPVGRQVAYSVYRLHFGQFGGFITKVVYLLFGLALTAVTVSGVNIWISKRGINQQVQALWAAWVWGVPVAICLSAIIALFFPKQALSSFWCISGVLLVIATRIQQASHIRKLCQVILIIGLLSLVMAHSLFFTIQKFSVVINTMLIIIALLCSIPIVRLKRNLNLSPHS